jgi:hypothetical protein
MPQPTQPPATPAAPAASPAPASPAPSTPDVRTDSIAKDTPSNPGRPGPQVLSVRKALGLKEGEKTGREQLEDRKKDVQERHVDGRFKPKAPPRRAGDEPAETAPATKKPKALQPLARTAPADAHPASPDPKADDPAEPVAEPAPQPAAPPKVKIGDKEMTPDEVAAYVADLEKKAASAAAPKPPEKPAEPAGEKTPEAIAAEQKAKDDAFLAQRISAFNPADYGIDLNAKTLDVILTGGEPAVKMLTDWLARIAAAPEMGARKWLTESVNPILEGYKKRLAPLEEMYGGVREHQRDTEFAAAFPDIAAHPEGIKTRREVDAALHRRYDKAVRLQNVGAADEDDLAFIRDFEAATPEQYQEDVALHTRRRLGITPGAQAAAPAAQPAPAAPNAAEPPPATPPATARPKPPGGHAPGGIGAARAPLNPQKAIIAGIRGIM